MESDGEGREGGVMEGGGAMELTPLGSLLPVSVHGCWPFFGGSHFICRWTFLLMGGT